MAARVLKPHHQEDVKRKIQVSQLVNLLQDNAFGRLKNPKGQHYELSKGQIISARILIDKCLSNAPTTLTGADGGPVIVEIVRFANPNS